MSLSMGTLLVLQMMHKIRDQTSLLEVTPSVSLRFIGNMDGSCCGSHWCTLGFSPAHDDYALKRLQKVVLQMQCHPPILRDGNRNFD
eukprot:scaffold2830_cov131-Cylindrotheca_fusiformis.AAC.24